MKAYSKVLVILSSTVVISTAIWINLNNWVSKDTHKLVSEYISTEVQTETEIETEQIETEQITIGPIRVETEVEEIIQEPIYEFSDDDKYLLAKIAMAEAEGEDIEGKAYVIMVILNRVSDDKFPGTIEGTIYEKNQFSPIDDGRFDMVEPNEECWQALDMIINGWDKSQGALYFESCPDPDNWHSRNLEYLFTHGGHRFYK